MIDGEEKSKERYNIKVGAFIPAALGCNAHLCLCYFKN